MDIAKLRDEFPTVGKLVYLNAGTDGPLPARAVKAAQDELARELLEGRSRAHFERRKELDDRLRASYASLLGCQVQDLALTACTSEGLSLIIGGMELGGGDEILTSDEEHPGLLGALSAARELLDVSIRVAPFAQIADAVSARTRLVACSHVSWMSGMLAPEELAQLEVPVILDGAQGVGAVPVDVGALGCDAYAGAGQKWLCGPDGTGMLYVNPKFSEQIAVTRRGYGNLLDPNAGLDAKLHPDARRFDALGLSAETVACALGATEVLEHAGWPAIHERSSTLAQTLTTRLQQAGREVTPRSQSTLVSFWSPDPEGERERLAQAGVVLRDIPGRPSLRASVGAWNNEDDLDRLLTLLA